MLNCSDFNLAKTFQASTMWVCYTGNTKEEKCALIREAIRIRKMGQKHLRDQWQIRSESAPKVFYFKHTSRCTSISVIRFFIFSNCFILLRVTVDLELIPGTLSTRKGEFTPIWDAKFNIFNSSIYHIVERSETSVTELTNMPPTSKPTPVLETIHNSWNDMEVLNTVHAFHCLNIVFTESH